MNKQLLLGLLGLLLCVVGVGMLLGVNNLASFRKVRDVSWMIVVFGAAAYAALTRPRGA